MKYTVTLYKGEPLTITQEEFDFIGQAKLAKKDSVFLQSSYIGMGNIAIIAPIKTSFMPDQLALPEKSEGTPLSPERFKELKERFSKMFISF